MNTKSILIGLAAGDHLAVDVMGYEYEKAGDRQDLNWLKSDLAVQAGTWSGKVRKAFFTTTELRRFREDVEALVRTKKGEARLEPMEPYVALKLSGDGTGVLEVSGVAFDSVGGVNALAFNWTEDIASAEDLVRQLKIVEKAFPPR